MKTPSLLHALWVEGKDDRHVLFALLQHHGIPQTFEVKEAGGVEPLLDGFAFQVTKGSDIATVGLIVDADYDAAARWQRVRGILSDAGYRDIPAFLPREGLILRTPMRPVVGVWLMPGNQIPGALEDFVAYLVPSGDALWDRASAAVEDIPAAERRFATSHVSKARIHTWLAWQDEPGSPLGLAITKRYLAADAPEATMLINWLRRLLG